MSVLKSELVKRNIKMKEFAKDMDITPQQLTRIAKSECLPRKELMSKISKALGMTIDELFFSDEEE